MNIKTNKNYLFIDFETTNQNKIKALPLELGFIMSKDNLKSFTGLKLNIKFEKSFDKCSSSEKKALIFNKINNQIELDIHNKKSHSLSSALNLFISYVEKFFEYKEFYLIGYNNFNYDNYILNKFLNKYYPHKSYSIMLNSFDIYFFINNARYYTEIKSELWNKSFASSSRSLINIYEHIFKKTFKAHDSLEDVKATIKLFNYYKTNFQKRLFIEMENSHSVFNIDDNLLLKKNEVGFKNASLN